jgi:hypothetical protein
MPLHKMFFFFLWRSIEQKQTYVHKLLCVELPCQVSFAHPFAWHGVETYGQANVFL